MAYFVAIAERVDRGELTMAGAKAQMWEVHLRILQERTRHQAEERQRWQAEAARLDAWNQFWLNLSLFQLLQRPIQCRTTYIGGLARTQCD